MLLTGSSKDLEKHLVGKKFQATFRHGKFLFIAISDGGNLLLHFGLTGDLLFVANGEAGPDKFALQILFEGDEMLFFTDTRKLGKLGIVEDADLFISEKAYGADALLISQSQFAALFEKKKTSVKALLMDQHLVAGVGNEYSDEILFQVRNPPGYHCRRC